jgi:hypothetical protein
MKADGGTLLYIALAVISLIVSAVRQNNKKKAVMPVPPRPKPDMEESQPDPPATWQKELEDIFGKVFVQPEEKKDAGTNEKVEHPKAPDTVMSDSQEIIEVQEAQEELAGTLAGKTTTSGKPLKKPVYADVPVNFLEDNALGTVVSEEFELRRAIIYSEVLNRKYF